MARTTGSDELYRLVHSLTTEEKGYFKKFAKRHTSEGNKYLELFDAVNKQEKFEESAFKKKYKGYADMKVYLFDMILQSVIASGSTAVPIDEIMKGLLQVNVLSRKGLTKRAHKELTALKLFAQTKSLSAWVAICGRMEYALATPSANPAQSTVVAQTIYNEIQNANSEQFQLDKLVFYGRFLAGLLKRKQFNEEIIEIDKEIDIIPLLHLKPINTIHTVFQLTSIRAYYRLKDDEENAYLYSEKLYTLQQKKWRESSTPKSIIDYATSAGLVLTSCFSAKRISRAQTIYDEVKNLNTSNTHLQRSYKIEMDNIQLLLHWYKGEHPNGEKQCALLKSIKEEPLKDAYYWALHLEAYCMKALFEFSNGNFTEAVKSLNYFIQPDISHISLQHKKGADFLRLLVQLEIENYDLVTSHVKSIKNRFKDLSNAENIFLRLVAKYYSSPDRFYDEYEKAVLEVRLFNTFDISDWVESKILRKKLSEVVRKNHGSK